jgi:RiboL-PSP-HEPN
MNCQQVNREKAKLDQLFKDSGELLREINKHSIDLEMQSHLAKYLCILASAFIENAVREMFSEYTRNKAAPAVVKYVQDQLRFFYNPKTNRILELVGAFDPQWRAALEPSIEDAVRDAVDSIVDNKNKIAHGKDSQITFVGISAYYQRALKLIDLIEQKCV